MTLATANFATDVFAASRELMPYARGLYRNDYAAAEDALSEVVLRAIKYKARFNGGSLHSWLAVMMKRQRLDARQKGYRNGTKPGEPRVTYPGAAAIPDLVDRCDPESILIAREIFRTHTGVANAL